MSNLEENTNKDNSSVQKELHEVVDQNMVKSTDLLAPPSFINNEYIKVYMEAGKELMDEDEQLSITPFTDHSFNVAGFFIGVYVTPTQPNGGRSPIYFMHYLPIDEENWFMKDGEYAKITTRRELIEVIKNKMLRIYDEVLQDAEKSNLYVWGQTSF